MINNQIKQHVRETIGRVTRQGPVVRNLTLTDEQKTAIRETGETIYAEFPVTETGKPSTELYDPLANDSGATRMLAYVMTGDAGSFHMEWFRYLHGINTEYRESTRYRRASEREYNRVARILGVPEIHLYTEAK